MFHVKTVVKQSTIHGLGLFADEDIVQDSIVYTPNCNLDLSLTEGEFNLLEESERKYISHYGFFNQEKQQWQLSYDNIKYCNHNKEGNVTMIDNKLIATKDIKRGEEITQNYEEFERLREELK